MHPAYLKSNDRAWYRCNARTRGYGKCSAPFIAVDELDRQVVNILANLVIPDGFKDRVELAVRTKIEHEAAFKRIGEIEEVIKRVDLRWEEGFISKDEYVEKRRQLQRELDSLQPVDYDELAEAADLLGNFKSYWNDCENQANPEEAKRQLIDKIVERVFVHDRKVMGVVLHGSYGIVIDYKETASAEIVDAVQETLLNGGITCSLGTYQNGSDGVRYRTCYLWSAFKIDYHIVVKYWLKERIDGEHSNSQSNKTNRPDDTSNLSTTQLETTV